MKPKQLIVIGGGSSIKEALSKNLWSKLEGKFTFGLNYSFNFTSSTIQLYVDKEFYRKELSKLAKLPLVIGKYHTSLDKIALPNTIMVHTPNQYQRDLKKGIYKASLVGIFAVSLGIHLLDEGTIFLLGFDFGDIGKDKDNRPLTHFYQGNLNHRGIGKINYYRSKNRANKDFGVYKEEKKVKIYNLSLNSRIPTFEKITYNKFFELLDDKQYNQDELREWIKHEMRKVPKNPTK